MIEVRSTFLMAIVNSRKHTDYNPITKKFLVSRDVKFMEDKSWNGMENNTSHNPFLELDEHQAPTTHLPRLQVQNEISFSSHSDLDFDHTHEKMNF